MALPECFNSPYGTKYFGEYAETIPDGFTCQELSKTAKELQIFLIGGSIPERDQDKLYNTCTVWGPTGDLVAKHRKMHLFDIDIPGGIRFKESEVLSPGDSFSTFQVNDQVKVGLGICYDIRFEEMARIYRNMGCNLLVYPGAFNMTTGPMHWELLARGRAVDSQCFVATVSPARDTTSEYVAFGHSMVVDPWAKVIQSAADGEETVIADLGLDLHGVRVFAKGFTESVLSFRLFGGGEGASTDSDGIPEEGRSVQDPEAVKDTIEDTHC